MGINTVIAVDFVGAGSPKFILPINNLNKPAPTPPIISIVDRFGAGFYHLSVVVNDIGEPAPTIRFFLKPQINADKRRWG